MKTASLYFISEALSLFTFSKQRNWRKDSSLGNTYARKYSLFVKVVGKNTMNFSLGDKTYYLQLLFAVIKTILYQMTNIFANE